MKKCIFALAFVCVAGLGLVGMAGAEPPTRSELDAAISSGNFSDYSSKVTTWLAQQVDSLATDSSVPGAATNSVLSAEVLKALTDDVIFRRLLDQRHLISKAGSEKLGAYAKANPEHARFLAEFLNDAERMDLYLEGGTPVDNETIGSFDVLSAVWAADAEARDGLYLRLAMATSLAHAKPQKSFDGEPIDALKRYEHFKAAHQNGELDPMFDALSVWELEKVVGSWASDADLAWGREMLRTMRPELVIEKRYVRQVSEVQYTKPDWGNPPHRFSNVLGGDGKCGPRAWFGRMINQSFGVPAWGVKQPAHAAVGFLGDTGWKVQYGAGWDKSTWGGMNGNQFVALATAREYRSDFSQAEHLRWLADAVTSKAQADVIRGVAEQIQAHPRGPRTANRLQGKRAFKVTPEAPTTPVPGVRHILAADFVKSSNAWRRESYAGGRQVNFQKNSEGWVEYKVDIPKAGKYELKTYHAVCNGRCRLRVYVGDQGFGWMHLRDTTGLWGESSGEWVFDLPATTTLRLVFPAQRGVALKWFELIEKPSPPDAAIQ